MSGWQPVASGLWRFEDTCNVYALVDGEAALVVDCGSAAWLDSLGELGVARVDQVWFTHAHRDQCQGAARLAELGVPLRFPAAARAWLDPAQRPDFHLPTPCHWRYPWPFRPPHPLPSAQFDLAAGQWLAWGPWDLELFAAPGHCDHQLAVLADGPAGLTLLCGDALHSAGCVHEAFQLENDHYTGGGARLAAGTLAALRNLKPDRLCPSHGPALEEALDEALTLTIDRLWRLADLKDTCVRGRPAVQRLCRPLPNTFVRVSEHLWLWNNSYFLRSDDGALLMVDADLDQGEAFWGPFHATFGDAPLEVVLVSHIHCDHVAGIEHARARYPRLECWALDYLVDGIERPESLPRPWMHDTPTHVDRVLGDGEQVRWHEYTFDCHWYPAQTDFHALYATTIDGHRALFTGDNFYPAQQWGGTGGLCGYNGGAPALWRQSAELTIRLAPEWLLASHRHPFVYRRADFEEVIAWSFAVAEAMAALAPDGCVRRHHDPHLCEARPYVQAWAPRCNVRLTVANPYPRPLHVRVELVPVGDVRNCVIPAGEQACLDWELAVPRPAGRAMFTFDVTVDGTAWGELTECYLRGD